MIEVSKLDRLVLSTNMPSKTFVIAMIFTISMIFKIFEQKSEADLKLKNEFLVHKKSIFAMEESNFY